MIIAVEIIILVAVLIAVLWTKERLRWWKYEQRRVARRRAEGLARKGPSDIEVPAETWRSEWNTLGKTPTGEVDWLEDEFREILPGDIVLEWKRHGGPVGSEGFAVERSGKIIATVTTKSYRFFGSPEALGKIKPTHDIFSAFERLREDKPTAPDATERNKAQSVHENLSPSDTQAPAGACLDNPYPLGPLHTATVEAVEKLYLVGVFGLENRDWFDEGSSYHKGRTICERRVRLKNNVVRSLFFDRSEIDFMRNNVSGDARDPLVTVVQEMYARAAKGARPSNTTLASRFPLIEIHASNAVGAAYSIFLKLRAARADGWMLTNRYMPVDDWRNEYEMIRDREKTVMSFDMRPALPADSAMNLVTLTGIVGWNEFHEDIGKLATFYA